MTGPALSNTFQLKISRGCSVRLLLRPAGLLPSLARAFDTPLGSVGSLLRTGVCYRALRRLPGQDFHLLDQPVFQNAPYPHIKSPFQRLDSGIKGPQEGACNIVVLYLVSPLP